MEQRPEARVARGALNIADAGIPVVAALVDEPKPQPDRIGKIDAGDAPRLRGAMIKCRRRRRRRAAAGKPSPAPAPSYSRIAAARRGIAGIEFFGHQLESRRQADRLRARRPERRSETHCDLLRSAARRARVERLRRPRRPARRRPRRGGHARAYRTRWQRTILSEARSGRDH